MRINIEISLPWDQGSRAWLQGNAATNPFSFLYICVYIYTFIYAYICIYSYISIYLFNFAYSSNRSQSLLKSFAASSQLLHNLVPQI